MEEIISKGEADDAFIKLFVETLDVTFIYLD